MWFGTICCVLPNQKLEICVSMLPFSGIGVGMMTSKAEMRSLVTIRSSSGPCS